MIGTLSSWFTIAALVILIALNCYILTVSMSGLPVVLAGPLKFATCRIASVVMLAAYIVAGLLRIRQGKPPLADIG